MTDTIESTVTRLFLFGVDGATWDIIQPLVERGELPNFAHVLEAGASGPLTSTVPPLTAPAWTSFFTGVNPGRHGILSFRNLDARSYACFTDGFVNSNSFQSPTLFDVLSEADRRVGVACVPLTYPAWPVNGVMVSGYPVADPDRAFHPPELREELGEELFWPSNTHNMPMDVLLKKVDALLEAQVSYMLRLIESDDYDFLMVNVDNCDNAVHHFWPLHDPESPVYDAEAAARLGDLVEDQYRKVDAALGRVMDALPEDVALVLMSDHGGGRAPDRQVHLNAWLQTQGLLATRGGGAAGGRLSRSLRIVKERIRFKDQLRRMLPEKVKGMLSRKILNLDAIDWSETRAYRVPFKPCFEGIAINLEGRQPEGVVARGADYERLRFELTRSLLELTDPETGERIVAEVHRREDLFHGNELEKIPDLILRLEDRYDGGTGLDGPICDDVPRPVLRQWAGNHKPNGIFAAVGAPFRAGGEVEDASLIDLMPTLLYAMGVPQPADLDGRVLAEVFTESARERRGGPKRAARQALARASTSAELSPEEEAEITDRLKGLGYL